MKKAILVSVFIVVAGLAAYIGYQAWERYQQENAWSYIPDHAVAIFECPASLDWLANNQQKRTWQTLTKLPYFRTLLQRLDALQLAEDSVTDFLNSRTITASLHVTKSDDFDYLFFVPVSTLSDKEQLTKTLNHFSKNPAYSVRTRSFQSFTITEIHSADASSLLFSYIIHRAYFIGSYTPFLVEDAIRTINKQTVLSSPRWEHLHKQPKTAATKTTELAVYIHPKAVPQLAKLLTATDQADYFGDLQYAAQSATFLAKIEKEGIHLEGAIHTLQDESQMDFLEIFRNQTASPSRMMHLLSDKTAIWYHWSFEDARRLRDALNNYYSKHEAATLKSQAAMWKAYQIRPQALYDWVDREIGLSIVDNGEPEPNRFVFVEAKDIDKAVSQLSEMASAVDRKNDEAPYLEQYAQIPIREIRIPDFPAKLFGKMFSGFSSCFYAPVQHHLVFSNSIIGLKTLLDDQATGSVSTWVIRQYQFANQQSNFGFFVRTSRAWSYLYQNSSAHWQNVLLSNSAYLKEFEATSFQITHGPVDCKADIWFMHNGHQPTANAQGQLIVSSKTTLEQAVGSQPFVVRNREDKSLEILIQDTSYSLILLDKKGQRVWKKPLEGPILPSVYQLDFHNNQQAHYLVATSNRLHLMDRDGNEGKNFPFALPDSTPIHTLSVLDYDKSEEYRFLLSNTKGYLYMFDKHSKLLEGWNPLKLDYWLSSPARHLRVRDKDYIVMLQENGMVRVVNRRGIAYEGFPITFKTKVSSPLFVDEGSTADQTFLTAITDYGEIIQFDLTGKIRRKEQVYRSSKNALFSICIEANHKDWLIVQRSNGKITLLNKQATMLFEKEELPLEKTLVQYQDLGNDIKIVSFTSHTLGKTALYDVTGKVMGSKPIENAFPLSMMYSESFNKLFIYRASMNNVGVWTMKLR